MLTEEEINIVLEDFPKFELSYEIITHKKVLDVDLYLAIPEGKKCIAWFTSFNADDVCFLMEIDSDKNISSVKIVSTSFNNKLAYGTIISGIVFEYLISNVNVNCFTIEDIYYYKGNYVGNEHYLEKLKIMKKMLSSEMSQIATSKKYMIFGLPLIRNNYDNLLVDIYSLPYKVKEIKFRCFKSKKIYAMKYIKSKSIPKCIFKITADIEPDIYNLFVSNKGKEQYYDVAFISSYNLSVMMNKLFRKIKENDNLDALEESDDEEEFEDDREDKFVYLDRSFNMVCDYNYKFKKWQPNCLANENSKVIELDVVKIIHDSNVRTKSKMDTNS